jgi:hypothetical protein
MILISHRGNINGKQPNKENHPDYIWEAIRKEYHVEIDVWFVNGKLKLGHDAPQYDFPFDLFENHYSKLWIHCKNLEAIVELNKFDKIGSRLNYFWHQTDDITLTSKGYIWAYPGKQPIENSIAVMPEINNDDVSKCIGVCSDYIINYK